MSVRTNTTGQATAAAAPRQEAVMGKAVASQHPAVVLRSHYRLVRALLAVAMIAVVGLSAAVVILANDGDELSGTSSTRPIESINYGGFNPATGRPESAPLPQQEQPLQTGSRYDGGPEEGTRGMVGSSSAAAADPLTSRYDGGPEEGTRGVAPPPSSLAASAAPEYERLRSPGTRYDGGPEEGSRGPGFSTD
jgi:hypothetical protein